MTENTILTTENPRSLTRKDIGEVVESSMVDYAEQTILDRAIPDVRDGLKPVQRRILFAMGELNLWFSGKTLKCARIVGEVLGKYHPHGDSSVYGALTRLAQDFAMRVPLVKGQGNFGSIDGDSPAAMRYTEAKLSAAGELMLADIDNDTVDFAENFDGTLKEPTVLPSRIPNLLINGTTGIAVGMSTDILPHNLNEICQAVAHIAEKWAKRDTITVDELMKFIPGPDLPTGGLLFRYRKDAKDDSVTDMIRTAYETGYSPLICQAKADIERNGKTQIIISEIPFQVSKTTILERIAKQKDRLAGKISDVVDESDQDGLRIVFEVARGCDPQEALEALLSYTYLRTTLSCNHLVLNIDDDGNMYPEIMSLQRILIAFIKHRLNVIVRRSEYEKKKAEARVHIVNGLLAALAAIEEVIAIIKKSRDVDTAKTNLKKLLKIDDIQAQAILDMQLRRLANLEVRKLQDEKKDLDTRIKALIELLKSEPKRLALIIADMNEINEKYPTPRRTIIVENESGHKETVTVADLLVPEKPQVVLFTTSGVVRSNADSYKDTIQPGKASIRAVETPLAKIEAAPQDNVLLVSTRGRLWIDNVGRLPMRGSFTDIGLDRDEELVGISRVDEKKILVMVTQSGSIKRTRVADVITAHSGGAWGAAIGLENSEDRLVLASALTDQAQVMIFTAGNLAKKVDPRALRFEANTVNPQATPSARGVAAIKLAAGDRILSAAAFEAKDLDDAYVVLVTDKGFAKRVNLSEYPLQGRAGQGVQAMKPNPASGLPGACTVATGSDWVDLISQKGKRLRLAVTDLPGAARAGRGESIIARFDGLFGDETIAAIAVNAGEKNIPGESEPKPARGKRTAKKIETLSKPDKAAKGKRSTSTIRTKTAKPAVEKAAAAAAKPASSRQRKSKVEAKKTTASSSPKLLETPPTQKPPRKRAGQPSQTESPPSRKPRGRTKAKPDSEQLSLLAETEPPTRRPQTRKPNTSKPKPKGSE